MTEKTEKIIVRDAEEFKKMPEEYQELVIHQLRAHTEGELTGADDYIQIFYPMAPSAYERKICCERAAEEMDHYVRGERVLQEIGVDTTYMLKQNIEQREYYKTEGVRRIGSWLGRGLFSFVGEAAVLAMIEEMRESSYRPMAEMCIPIVMDEYQHVAHGFRIIADACRTDEGREAVQKELPKAWATTLDLFGKSDSERSKLYLKWGLRTYSNEEARQRFIKYTKPRVEVLGLTIPEDAENRRFL